jgi:S1-C subfamily serine protease
MGITGTGLTADLARQRRLTVDHGILLLEILPGGPADLAGLRGAVSEGPPGDVITSINGDPIDDWEDLLDFLATREPGQRLRLGIVRGSDRYAVTLVLGARP